MQTLNDKSAEPLAPKSHGPDRKTGRKARIPLSCGPCRYRKLKCNRQQPCQNCIVRKEPNACIFTGSENRAASAISNVQAENMQHRIDRLENLVTSLVSQKKHEGESRSSGNISQNNTPAYSSTSQTLAIVATEIAASEKIKEGQGMLNLDNDYSAPIRTAHQDDQQKPYQLEPDDFEADQLIKLYQDEMTNQFPFVVIPPGTTASNFRRDLPLLYRAVIMATSSDYPSRQAFYEKQIVEFVTDHLLIRSHKNLDLLQGILLFITWYKRNTMVVTQLNNLLQLAIALIDDLYLNRSPTWFHKSKVLLALACSRSVKYGPKTMDERRALLGCFYLSSVAATSFQRLDSMRLTRQIEESCQALLEKPEYPTDLQVAYVVKAQYLTDRIAQNIHINEGNIVHSPKTPIEMHIKAFQSEIFAMRESLSPSLRLNTSVLMHLDFASMRLYEVALLDNPQNPTTNPIATDPAHLENLYSLLLSTKSFITATLATPGATYLSLSYIAWTQFTYSVAVLDRLTFFKSPSCPSWDVPFVRSVIDLSTVLSTFAGRFEQAREHTCSQMMPGENSLRVEQANLYNRYALRTQMVREWFEHKAKFGNSANWDWEQAKVRLINAFEGKNKGMEQEHTPIPPTMAGYDIVELKDGNMQLDPSLFDGLNDDSFWLNLLGEWGDGPGV